MLDTEHRGVYHRKLCTFLYVKNFFKKYGFGGGQVAYG